MPNIHDELQRLVLRARWIKWSLRNYCPGVYKMPDGKHMVLSERLTKARPTWEQRTKQSDDPEFD